MKKQISSLLVSAGMLALLGSSAVTAQELSRESATVPFRFHASSTTLPAGKYDVKLNSSMGVFQISDAMTGRSIMVAAFSRESGKNVNPRLTFRRYGNEYFLSEIWIYGQPVGYKVGTSSREKEMAKGSGPVTLASIRLVH